MNAADDDDAEELRRRKGSIGPTQDEELLAKRLALLSNEQRQQYQNHVNNATEAHACEASIEFRLGLTKTYLQGLPLHEEAVQICDYIKAESARVDRDNDRARQEIIRAKLDGIDPAARHHPAQNQPDQKRPAQNQPTQEQASPERGDPMQGMRPSVAQRDYSELKKTHEQVAQRLAAEAQSPTASLSKEQLEDMSKHFADVREAHKLERSRAELREIADLSRMQTKARENLDNVHGPEPDPQQKQQRELLDHQHLAERVGVEGRWLGQDLRRKQLPGAEQCEQEGRRAHHAGREFHEQRQKLEANPVRDFARVIQKQDQQQQTELQQEALRSGRTVTDGRRANDPENSKKGVDRQERAGHARDGKGKGNDPKQISHKGPTRPGNARGGGGRSR